jgi:secreted trypsin-like serine protease
VPRATNTIPFSPKPTQHHLVNARIVGGEVLNYPRELQWLVSLQTASGSHFCGGTLLGTNWIMTAAQYEAKLKPVQATRTNNPAFVRTVARPTGSSKWPSACTRWTASTPTRACRSAA